MLEARNTRRPQKGPEVLSTIEEAVTWVNDFVWRIAEAGALTVPVGVARMWQDDQPQPTSINDSQRVRAGQPTCAHNRHQRPLSVPHVPWYY